MSASQQARNKELCERIAILESHLSSAEERARAAEDEVKHLKKRSCPEHPDMAIRGRERLLRACAVTLFVAFAAIAAWMICDLIGYLS